jgi:hypothetical protein
VYEALSSFQALLRLMYYGVCTGQAVRVSRGPQAL